MKLERIILSEITKAKKDKYHLLFLPSNFHLQVWTSTLPKKYLCNRDPYKKITTYQNAGISDYMVHSPNRYIYNPSPVSETLRSL